MAEREIVVEYGKRPARLGGWTAVCRAPVGTFVVFCGRPDALERRINTYLTELYPDDQLRVRSRLVPPGQLMPTPSICRQERLDGRTARYGRARNEPASFA